MTQPAQGYELVYIHFSPPPSGKRDKDREDVRDRGAHNWKLIRELCDTGVIRHSDTEMLACYAHRLWTIRVHVRSDLRADTAALLYAEGVGSMSAGRSLRMGAVWSNFGYALA